MAKILLGIPSKHIDIRFLESLPSFLKDLSQNHTLELFMVYGRQICEAQNKIAEKFLSDDYTHLLLIEDDHWGFQASWIEEMLVIDADVVTVPTYSRYFPYWAVPFKIQEDGSVRKNIAHQFTSGVHQVDYCGMYFNLIRRSAFLKIEKPYFQSDRPDGRKSDKLFCEEAKFNGVTIKCLYGNILPHRNITKENVSSLRVNFKREEHFKSKRQGELVCH